MTSTKSQETMLKVNVSCLSEEMFFQSNCWSGCLKNR